MRVSSPSLKSPVLQLNAAYEPLRIITAREAVLLLTQGRAAVVVETDKVVWQGMYLPSVIKLRVYRYLRIRIRLVSRRNILQRDGYRCQYCGEAFDARDLTLDHVIPRVQGGQRTWENLVAACAPCNRRKGGRTPLEAEMSLLRRPIPASVHTSRHVLRSAGMVVPGWRKYLFGDHNGDPRYVYREAA